MSRFSVSRQLSHNPWLPYGVIYGKLLLILQNLVFVYQTFLGLHLIRFKSVQRLILSFERFCDRIKLTKVTEVR